MSAKTAAVQRQNDRRIATPKRSIPLLVTPGVIVPFTVFGAIFVAFSSARTGLPLLEVALLGAVGGEVALLVHELGHVHAARKVATVSACRIRLTAFGAASEFDGAYSRGRDQLRVAAGGPAASLALAALLTIVAALPLSATVRSGSLALALLNAAVAVLCAIPVAPLDGYKIIVGVLWWITGSESKASTLIRRAGAVCGTLALASAALLALERPAAGSSAAAMLGVLFAQKHIVVRRRQHVPLAELWRFRGSRVWPL